MKCQRNPVRLKMLKKQKKLLKQRRRSSLRPRVWANKRRNKDPNWHKKINSSNRKLKLPLFTTILILLRKQKGQISAHGRQQKPWKNNWEIRAMRIDRLSRNKAALTIIKASTTAQSNEIRKRNFKTLIIKLKTPNTTDSQDTRT